MPRVGYVIERSVLLGRTWNNALYVRFRKLTPLWSLVTPRDYAHVYFEQRDFALLRFPSLLIVKSVSFWNALEIYSTIHWIVTFWTVCFRDIVDVPQDSPRDSITRGYSSVLRVTHDFEEHCVFLRFSALIVFHYCGARSCLCDLFT